jgi:hypothetical protein
MAQHWHISSRKLSVLEKNGSNGAPGKVWSMIEFAAEAGCDKKTSMTAKSSSVYMAVCVEVAA